MSRDSSSGNFSRCGLPQVISTWSQRDEDLGQCSSMQPPPCAGSPAGATPGRRGDPHEHGPLRSLSEAGTTAVASEEGLTLLLEPEPFSVGVQRGSNPALVDEARVIQPAQRLGMAKAQQHERFLGNHVRGGEGNRPEALGNGSVQNDERQVRTAGEDLALGIRAYLQLGVGTDPAQVLRGGVARDLSRLAWVILVEEDIHGGGLDTAGSVDLLRHGAGSHGGMVLTDAVAGGENQVRRDDDTAAAAQTVDEL